MTVLTLTKIATANKIGYSILFALAILVSLWHHKSQEDNTSLLLSHCWAKASSHTGKACALIATLAQDGWAISDLY